MASLREKRESTSYLVLVGIDACIVGGKIAVHFEGVIWNAAVRIDPVIS